MWRVWLEADVLVVSTLPPFHEVADARKNNALGARFAHFLAKKGGQKAPISPNWKIREPRGPADRHSLTPSPRDPSSVVNPHWTRPKPDWAKTCLAFARTFSIVAEGLACEEQSCDLEVEVK